MYSHQKKVFSSCFLEVLAHPEVEALANPQRWKYIASHSDMVWGEIQGSRPQPYCTQINRVTHEMHCTCPTHKQPCKHGLALALLFIRTPASFTQADHSPEWAYSLKRSSTSQKRESFAPLLEAIVHLLGFFV